MELEPLLHLADGSVLSVWSLIMAGLLGGLTAGLLGIGGGAIVNPLLISFGLAPRLATACMSVAIIANASGASVYSLRHWNVDIKLGLYMGLAGILGGQAGTLAIAAWGKPDLLDTVIRIGFLILLIFLAWKLWRGNKGANHALRGLLFSLPFRRSSVFEQEPVSPVAPVAAALGVGVLAALLGIGGGIFYVPLLMALFGRDIRELVPVSQIAVLLGSISVATGHVLHTGNIEPRVALVLVLSGSVGTAVGSRFKKQLDARHLEKLFAFVLLGGAIRMGLQLVAAPAAVVSASSPPQGADVWLGGFLEWASRNQLHLWLATAGLALVAGPVLAWVQHTIADRFGS